MLQILGLSTTAYMLGRAWYGKGFGGQDSRDKVKMGGCAMTYTICVLAGLVIGSLAAWLIASARITKSFTFKMEESERRANLAEGRASGLEATVTELRGQNQKAFEDFTKLRDQFGNENCARVKAETRLAETVQRLEEERILLDDAKAKLTDTLKALAALEAKEGGHA